MKGNKMVLSHNIFRKSSSNGHICLYLGQRTFTDYLTHVEPVDGMVWVNEEAVENRKVVVQVTLTYRYGREEDEVMGLSFAKEVVVTSQQVFPEINEREPLTIFQERLTKKMGEGLHPFTLKLPLEAPPSVTLQSAPGDKGKACGVEWEVRALICSQSDDPPHPKSLVKMTIRRQQYTDAKPGAQPIGVCSKDFLLSPGPLNLQVTLDKQVYYPGDSVCVNVQITNHSNKHVKKIKITSFQLCEVSLGVSGQLRSITAHLETQQGCPISSRDSCSQNFSLTPTVLDTKGKRGLAISTLSHRSEQCLAPSTLFVKPQKTMRLGMVISYLVKVKLCLGPLGGEVITEVPYTLMHLPPSEEPPPLIVPQIIQKPDEKGKEPSTERI